MKPNKNKGFTPHLLWGNEKKNLESIRKDAGFTLIELLVVIFIVALLAAIGAFAYNQARQKAKRYTAQAEIYQIMGAIKFLEHDSREWPGHQTIDQVNLSEGNEIWDLNVEEAGLTQNDSVNSYSNWDGPYMLNVPRDPWGNNYFFDTDYDINQGQDTPQWGVVIGSFGPNGVGPDLYDEDDIIRVIYQ